MDPDALARNLGQNLRQLREARGLAQQQLAERAGIPRATWANLASGGANPTLAVLARVAGALEVSIEELIAAPRAVVRLYRAAELRQRGRSGVEVRQLLPDPLPGLCFERMLLPPEARMTGVPHTPGTREYLAAESGEVALTVSGERFVLGPGDVAVFRGDQRHGYANPTAVEAVAYSVVVLDPSESTP